MTVYRLDLIGNVCPVPLLRTEQKMKGIKTGDVLVVETEHGRAARNILEWAQKNHYPVKVTEVDNGIWEVTIRKTAPGRRHGGVQPFEEQPL